MTLRNSGLVVPLGVLLDTLVSGRIISFRLRAVSSVGRAADS